MENIFSVLFATLRTVNKYKVVLYVLILSMPEKEELRRTSTSISLTPEIKKGKKGLSS